ncbi:hypothetical protein [Pseudomonas syringae group genomosp. 3]|uniref:Uncharacterized protein n=1 Tax=Pseudomonas syringae pv. coriandricola TaxID=264453 RepID=A0A3M3JU51_9PSED|nr:hypothetical protein [Pseudomonas syringae group genomosp. 3]RMN13511.1 hypothetical protein ALQ65_200272 [Pseudomonas syringae pv. coriandricola]
MSESTDKKVRYDALVAYEYKSGEATKTGWTRVGAGFQSADGKTINIDIVPNVSVSNRLILKVWEPKPDQAG